MYVMTKILFIETNKDLVYVCINKNNCHLLEPCGCIYKNEIITQEMPRKGRGNI